MANLFAKVPIEQMRNRSTPPSSTFVVRLWHEWTAEGLRWRGRIEHVQSGENAVFLELDAMLSFLRRFGVEADDQGQRTREET